MNTSKYNSNSYAFKLGAQAAQNGDACVPECIFVSRRQQVDFAAGFESVSGPTFVTAQFTGSEVPAPVAPIIVPNYRRNDREFVRRIDGAADTMFKADAARCTRIDKMLAATAAFLGVDAEPDIIFAA